MCAIGAVRHFGQNTGEEKIAKKIGKTPAEEKIAKRIGTSV